MAIDWNTWETHFAQFLAEGDPTDAAHDLAHIRRVVASAKQIAAIEHADLAVVVPAAWLHDCVIVPKDSPLRSSASQQAAQRAGAWLQTNGYPAQHIDAIQHAIAAHSFSARIPPRTLEAQVVQDADRLDALGAVGIARCLMLGGALGRPLYDEREPFPDQRPPDDRRSSIDHFYTKLLTLASTMQTLTGRAIAEQRTAFMQAYLDQLRQEVEVACSDVL